MAKLYTKTELADMVVKLADVVQKMSDDSKYCVLCEMHEDGQSYHCWCDYDSPAYIDDGDL